MIYLLQTLRTHWLAICGALLMSMLVAAPLIAFPFYAGDAYRGINIAHFGNDEHYYLSRAKEVLEGKNTSQPFISVYKDTQDPTFSAAEYLLVWPLHVIGLNNKISIISYYNILNTVAVFALVLMIYAFALRFYPNRLSALAIAIFVIGGYSIVENKTFFFTNFNVYGRSLFPWVSSIPFFGFLICLYDSLVLRRGMRSIVTAGLLLGLLCWLYFFGWTYGFAVLGSYALVALFYRDWYALKTVMAIGLIGFLFGSYNIAHLLSFYSSVLGKQLAYFLLAQHGRVFVMSKIGLVLIVILLAYAAFLRYQRRGDQNIQFLGALALAGWIALDQQLLTGRILQYGHYYWYFIAPLAIIGAGYVFVRFFEARTGRLFAYFLIISAFLNTLVGQYRSFFVTAPWKMREQDYAPLIAKLSEGSVGDVLTSASSDTYAFLPVIMTNDDLYWTPTAQLHPFPIERLEDALLLHLFINKESRVDPIGYLRKAVLGADSDEIRVLYEELEGYRSGFDYYDYRARLERSDKGIEALREELFKEIASQYESDFSNRGMVRKYLQSVGVRYILWDKQLNPNWDLSVFDGIVEIAHGPSLVLYRLDS